MKKSLSATLALCLAMGLAGCGNDKAPAESAASANMEVSAPAEKKPAEKAPTAKGDADKEQKYQAALQSFNEGSSHSVYYEFKALGDYKDSAQLAQDAVIQNKLNFFTAEPANWFKERKAQYPIIEGDALAQTFAGKTWLVPNFQSVGYMEYTFNSDGTGSIFSSLLNEKWQDFTWSVNERGIEIHYAGEQADGEVRSYPVYKEDYHQVNEDVYIQFSPEAEAAHPNGGMPVAYIAKDSDFGKRYVKGSDILVKISEDNPNGWTCEQDENGLYYAHVEK
jgi:hypothetical protein